MEVSTIIVKQKDLGCGATKVHIIDQDLETNDAQTRLFWKTLGGKADVAGNALHSSFLLVLLVSHFYLPVYFPFSYPVVEGVRARPWRWSTSQIPLDCQFWLVKFPQSLVILAT